MQAVMLGDPVRDTVTGYEGTLVKTMQTLHGHDEGCVERADGSGVPEEQWFALARLEYRP